MSKFGWGLFLTLTFIITLPASWWVLAKADFAYAYLYDGIGIEKHITKYAPKNTQGKKHFELTSKVERVALFHGVVEAIQSGGSGLKELSYIDKTAINKEAKDKTKSNVPLFTSAEVIHLQDVANLLDKLKVLVLVLAILWLIIIIILWRIKKPLANSKQFLVSTVIIMLISAAILSIGPEAIFNQLHRWIFPDDHQWFFYYEESLMSTMMKAPDLFAYIMAIWVLLSSILTIVAIKLLRSLLTAKKTLIN